MRSFGVIESTSYLEQGGKQQDSSREGEHLTTFNDWGPFNPKPPGILLFGDDDAVGRGEGSGGGCCC